MSILGRHASCVAGRVVLSARRHFGYEVIGAAAREEARHLPGNVLAYRRKCNYGMAATLFIGAPLCLLIWSELDERQMKSRFEVYRLAVLSSKKNHAFAPIGVEPNEKRSLFCQHRIGFDSNTSTARGQHIVGMRIARERSSHDVHETRMLYRDYLIYWGQRSRRTGALEDTETAEPDVSWVDARFVRCPEAEAEYFRAMLQPEAQRAISLSGSQHRSSGGVRFDNIVVEEFMVGPFASGAYVTNGAEQYSGANRPPAWTLPGVHAMHVILELYFPKA